MIVITTSSSISVKHVGATKAWRNGSGMEWLQRLSYWKSAGFHRTARKRETAPSVDAIATSPIRPAR